MNQTCSSVRLLTGPCPVSLVTIESPNDWTSPPETTSRLPPPSVDTSTPVASLEASAAKVLPPDAAPQLARAVRAADVENAAARAKLVRMKGSPGLEYCAQSVPRSPASQGDCGACGASYAPGGLGLPFQR